MMRLSKKIKQAIIKHRDDCYPLECCGVIVNKNYIACRNVASAIDGFEIDPCDIVKTERLGDIQAIVHSHPHGTSQASEMDKKQMTLHRKPWVIVGKDGDFSTYENH